MGSSTLLEPARSVALGNVGEEVLWAILGVQ